MNQPSTRISMALSILACAHAFTAIPQLTQHSFPSRKQQLLHMSIPGPLDTFTSGLVSIIRYPKGVTVLPSAASTNPRQSIQYLYNIENDRDCRQVRERLTELNCSVERVVPAAPNSKIWSGGPYPPLPQSKNPSDACSQLPCIILTNGQSLLGATAILDYLESEYPSETTETDSTFFPATVMRALDHMNSHMAVLLRHGKGTAVVSAAQNEYPNQPLALYSYEGNQFCRLVREVLTELDLPYELWNVGKESPRRAELAALTGGSTQCPYLVDPNTDTRMFESKVIVAYLYKTYARWTPPNELLQWTSNMLLPLAQPLLARLTLFQAGRTAENKQLYETAIHEATLQIDASISSYPVVVYTYSLSPFSWETKALLDRLTIEYKEVSLGAEWIPGLLKEPVMRAALLEKTGQSSLPHIFVGGESIGGLFSGTPGLIPLLETNQFMSKVAAAFKSTENIMLQSEH